MNNTVEKTKRINISINTAIYQRLKAKCFIENKSVSGFIAESVVQSLSKNNPELVEVILSSKDEEHILEILSHPENKDSMTREEFKKKFNL